MRLFISLWLWLLLLSLGWSQSPSPLTSSTPSSASAAKSTISTDVERRQLALKILEMTDSLRPIEASIDAWIAKYKQAYPTLDEQIWKQVHDKLRLEMLRMTSDAWARHYSKEDLQAFINFYESPAGRNLIHSRPNVVKDVVQGGEKVGIQMDGVLQSLALPQNRSNSIPQTSPSTNNLAPVVGPATDKKEPMSIQRR